MGGLENGHWPDKPSSKLTQHAMWFPFFTCASVSMVLLNKFCAHQFQQPYSLLGFQNSVTIILNAVGIWGGIFTVKPFTVDQFKLFLLPTFLFVFMLVTRWALPLFFIEQACTVRPAVQTSLPSSPPFLASSRPLLFYLKLIACPPRQPLWPAVCLCRDHGNI